MPNRLISSGSPYLLQHAHNPVDWYEWGQEALQKAQAEHKPIIVSIGYSACHWCHVMERECFENETLAKIMNENFVCIKIDREERPDIDAIYMDAVQNMGLRGGWPLNVFLTADTKPFYGGTYFPPQNWQTILTQVSNAYQNHREDIEKSADGFIDSLNKSDIEKYSLFETDTQISKTELHQIYEAFAKSFDTLWGGMNKAPKFPMPANYLFLLRLWKYTGTNEALNHVVLTLKRMALGGIYDQVGGGFARYSTDGEWFLPHFEKMLYDNGQLLSLYAEAYQATHEPVFKRVVYETVDFVKRELTNADGGFYSALDADSEGEEGKFYVWTKAEIEIVLGSAADIFCDYFNITEPGNWEHGNNILCCDDTMEAYCTAKEIDAIAFDANVREWKSKLLEARSKRIRPGLDNKIITSWNGLMLNGLIDAYRVFDEPAFLEMALKNAQYIQHELSYAVDGHHKLYHTNKFGRNPIVGFLEDYAFVIQAYINLYQTTFDEHWLELADGFMANVLESFIDEEEAFFYFTDKNSEQLIARKKEIFDNVIPASNSQMCINLFLLGKIFDYEPYLKLAEHSFGKIKKMLLKEPNYLSNWGNMGIYLASPTKEIAISGSECINYRKELDKIYMPNKIMVGTIDQSKLKLSLLEGREAKETTMIYVCENKVCNLPVESVQEALKILG